MKRTLGISALLLLAAMTAACGVGIPEIFEDVGTDPHPPTVDIIGLVLFVEEEPPEPAVTDRSSSSRQGRSVSWDSGGFTLSTGQKFQIGLAYTDAGGDIERFRLRDRDGNLSLELSPVDLTYFSGTSGKAFGPEQGQELIGIYGPHRLELWAEDSHQSRSEKVEFIITLVP